MPLYDDVFLADYDRHLKNIEEAETWFRQLYYNPHFSTIFEQTRLSLMLSGYKFLIDNLRELKLKYLIKPEKKA